MRLWRADRPPRTQLGGILALLGAAVLYQWFELAGPSFDHYRQPASSPESIPQAELAYHALYLAYGLPFIGLFVLGLWWTGVGDALLGSAKRLLRSPRAPYLFAFATVVLSIAVRLVV